MPEQTEKKHTHAHADDSTTFARSLTMNYTHPSLPHSLFDMSNCIFPGALVRVLFILLLLPYVAVRFGVFFPCASRNTMLQQAPTPKTGDTLWNDSKHSTQPTRAASSGDGAVPHILTHQLRRRWAVCARDKLLFRCCIMCIY